MTHEEMWRRYRNIMKKAPSDYVITCPVCNEKISDGDAGVEYVKTKRGSEIFIHNTCVKCWGKVDTLNE